jgi:signal transduction histidine kinase
VEVPHPAHHYFRFPLTPKRMLDLPAGGIIPKNDADRLEALYRYKILDTPPEAVFDNITEMMAHVFDMPMAFISLVGDDKVFYKSKVGGFPYEHVMREDSLCSLTILHDEPLVIENALAEICLREGPYVAPEGGIRFYAGAPLITKEGSAIGTVCVVDTVPRAFTEESKGLLLRFAKLVMHEIEVREALMKQKLAEEDLETSIGERTQQLRQQSDFANSILDASTNAFMVLDAMWGQKGEIDDFRIIKINNAFTSITGLDDSIVGRSYRALFPSTDKSGVFELYKRVLTTGNPERKEIFSSDQDLNSWFDLSVVRRGENGVVISFTNISPQRQAAIRIEQQKALLDNILAHSPTGITVTEFVRDEAGNIIDGVTIMANEVSEKHTGVSVAQSLNKRISENLPDILESPLFKMAVQTAKTGEPFITQYFIDRTHRWIELSVAKMDDDHLINVFTDVTPIKEAQLKQEELVEQLKRSNEELEQFTYVSHHDLQEPLRKILMFTDMVKTELSDQLPESAATRLEKVSSAARRMSAALKDVLNFASLNKEEQFTAVDLDEVLASVQSDLELAIQEKKAKITSDALPTVRAVPHQMHQLFYNLVNNALKFIRPDVPPQITITCRELPGSELKAHLDLDADRAYYEIDVRDNGIGFRPDAAEKIFAMFQRLHGKEAFAGTGIGLALCRKVAQNHGGKIWAESRQGEGATFKIILPTPPPAPPQEG